MLDEYGFEYRTSLFSMKPILMSSEIDDSVSMIASITSISVINMSYFHGLELSMNAGMDMAIGDFVFEFDNTCLDLNRLLL